MLFQRGSEGGEAGFTTGAVASPATNFANAVTTYFTFAVPGVAVGDSIAMSLTADISAITATAALRDPPKCLVAGTVRAGFTQASGGDLAGTVLTANFAVVHQNPLSDPH